MLQSFCMNAPDFELSPYTGMTRDEWIRAGEHLLKGIFGNIKEFTDPVVMPRRESEITYPHSDSPAVWHEAERRAEMFEGLTRSLFIAAPLLKNNPDLELSGFSIAAYYKSHILRSCTTGDPVSVSNYEQLQELTGHVDSFRAFQQTVETCALVIGLWVCRDVIWESYTKEEKDTIARFLTSYAHAPTVPQNWRLFNMLDMAFLNMYGYPIDEEIMMDHASAILGYYAGDGWYRDGHCFDYYSCWAFQVYAPIWNLWYGYEHAPDIAEKFEEYSNKLMETYPDFFDEDGHTNMWGRSNIYRCAAASALDANLMLRHPSIDPGLARRICSGSLLQFITREDFYFKGIPNMGFYGQFEPLVQGYSCAESPFWMGKIFLCLDLPADHPFWTAKEKNGRWDSLTGNDVYVTTLDGPALCFSNHKKNRSTILRTGKIVKNCGDDHAMWNYSKLAYNSKYPWESTPKDMQHAEPYPVESQQYVLTDDTDKHSEKCNVTFWQGEREGVLYRRQYFNYTLDRECMWMQAVSLADFAVPAGLIRVDRIRLFRRPVTITLGSWGFPDNGTEVITKEKKYISAGRQKMAKAVVLRGKDSLGCPKQLAMTIYDGWDDLKLIESRGTNPESEKSIVLYGCASRRKQYGGAEPYLMICQMLTTESHDDFSEEELFPMSEIIYSDKLCSGGYGEIQIRMQDGTVHKICFDEMEGNLLL